MLVGVEWRNEWDKRDDMDLTWRKTWIQYDSIMWDWSWNNWGNEIVIWFTCIDMSWLWSMKIWRNWRMKYILERSSIYSMEMFELVLMILQSKNSYE